MPLPTKKTKPITEFSEYSILIWGGVKIGKSTFCSHAPNALFIPTEPGLKCLDVYNAATAMYDKKCITTWDEFLEICKEIIEGKHDFKTIIIDTIEGLYDICEESVCKKYKVETSNDGILGYGKGMAIILNEFRRILTKLANLPYGLIMTSHAFDKDIDDKNGKYTKTVPTIPDAKKNSPYRFIMGFVDMILYCSQEKAKIDGELKTVRVIKTKPSLSYDAGDRTGKLPGKLPLDFEKFIKCFDTATKTDKVDKPKPDKEVKPTEIKTADANNVLKNMKGK